MVFFPPHTEELKAIHSCETIENVTETVGKEYYT